MLTTKQSLIASHGGTGHPVASIHAPIRKLRILANQPEPVVAEPVDDGKCRNIRPVPGSYKPQRVQVRGTCSECGAVDVSMTRLMNLRPHNRPTA